ncbi:MAG TPA: phosphatase PAP2 family protein [Thermoanaerobaculia bacterium]|nr:phosphatase PAP2 family protein [Thermoanaerobaculia bacterium]
MARATLALLLLTLVSCTSARMVGRDLTAVAKAPAREWKKVAAGTAVVGAALLLDDELARVARNNDSDAGDDVARLVEPFGGGHSDKVMAGFLLYGMAGKNERARDVAFDAFISSMIASKGITPALKAVVHRERPNGGDDAFASNHATQAFTVASVIAAHYGEERPWVRWLAYGIATGVGASRIYHDAHWTSDVLAGAGIGALVGHTVVRTNREARAQWRVTATRNGAMVQLTW